jgi:methylglutaconyl-CoA hydratase
MINFAPMTMVHTSVSGGIGTITMARPEKRNALGPAMVEELGRAFTDMGMNDAVRVVVLRGEGKAFCAGADLGALQQISENSPLENLDDSTKLKEMLQAIVDLPKPVIAMVHGAAIAGGCGLATVCDIVLAGRQHGVFGYSEVKIGFIPAIVMVYLLRKVGDTQARRLVLTAQNISAEEAVRIGLATFVVDDEQLEQETYALASSMAKNSASAMALSKSMLSSLHGMSLDAGLHYATVMNALARQTPDCKQGIAAFLQPKHEK